MYGYTSGSDDEDNPLRAGMWMDGDSLVSSTRNINSFALCCSHLHLLLAACCATSSTLLAASRFLSFFFLFLNSCISFSLSSIAFLPLSSLLLPHSQAPPCGCETPALNAMIAAACITQDDAVLDLGCGDGRLCFAAVEAGASRSVGVEIEEDVAQAFAAKIAERKLDKKVQCIQGDLREIDLSNSSVIFIYLLPEGIEAIEQSLVAALTANPKLRVLCNTWGLKSLEPFECVTVDDPNRTIIKIYKQNEALQRR
jgi:SAM-dependent methyltransferase